MWIITRPIDDAKALVDELCEGSTRWAIPWPSVHEFFSVVTHPRIYRPASTPQLAVAQLRAWLGSPMLTCLSESDGHFEVLAELTERGDIRGPQVHDARIAALCLANGIDELWSADRDFSRFASLRVRNPLV